MISSHIIKRIVNICLIFGLKLILFNDILFTFAEVMEWQT